MKRPETLSALRPKRGALVLMSGLAMAMGGALAPNSFLSAGLAPHARAEAFGRVYTVTAQLQPTPLVAEDTPQTPATLSIEVDPTVRHGRQSVRVNQGSAPIVPAPATDKGTPTGTASAPQGGWKIDSYKMRVFLHPGPDGGSDDGTVDYQILAAVSHTKGDSVQSIYARNHGTIKLKNGTGDTMITNSKYFTGPITVQLSAPEAGW